MRKEIPCGPNLPWTNRIVQRNVDWDGGLPENDWSGLLNVGFDPVECKTGDLLVFCRELWSFAGNWTISRCQTIVMPSKSIWWKVLTPR